MMDSMLGGWLVAAAFMAIVIAIDVLIDRRRHRRSIRIQDAWFEHEWNKRRLRREHEEVVRQRGIDEYNQHWLN